MTLVFVLLQGLQASPAAIFDTREACTAYAVAKLDEGVPWRCIPVPTRADEGDELE
jgi:hypothetical protein